MKFSQVVQEIDQNHAPGISKKIIAAVDFPARWKIFSSLSLRLHPENPIFLL